MISEFGVLENYQGITDYAKSKIHEEKYSELLPQVLFVPIDRARYIDIAARFSEPRFFVAIVKCVYPSGDR